MYTPYSSGSFYNKSKISTLTDDQVITVHQNFPLDENVVLMITVKRSGPLEVCSAFLIIRQEDARWPDQGGGTHLFIVFNPGVSNSKCAL